MNKNNTLEIILNSDEYLIYTNGCIDSSNEPVAGQETDCSAEDEKCEANS